MGSLPKVVCPTFFYLLVYGLLRQGFILMESLGKKIGVAAVLGLGLGGTSAEL